MPIENTSLYFFSTLAQVWAALVVFGALALRDHVQKLESSMDRAFLEMMVLLRPLQFVLQKCFADFDPKIFMEKHQTANFLVRHKFQEMNLWEAYRNEMGSTASSFTKEGVEASQDRVKIYLAGFISERNGQGNYRKLMKRFLLQGIGVILLALVSVAVSFIFENSWVFYSVASLELVLSLFPLHSLLSAFDIKLFSRSS